MTSHWIRSNSESCGLGKFLSSVKINALYRKNQWQTRCTPLEGNRCCTLQYTQLKECKFHPPFYLLLLDSLRSIPRQFFPRVLVTPLVFWACLQLSLLLEIFLLWKDSHVVLSNHTHSCTHDTIEQNASLSCSSSHLLSCKCPEGTNKILRHMW